MQYDENGNYVCSLSGNCQSLTMLSIMFTWEVEYIGRWYRAYLAPARANDDNEKGGREHDTEEDDDHMGDVGKHRAPPVRIVRVVAIIPK